MVPASPLTAAPTTLWPEPRFHRQCLRERLAERRDRIGQRRFHGTIWQWLFVRSLDHAGGRYVAFDSVAINLVAGDTNGHYDVFLHDLQTGITKRISGTAAVEGDNESYYPSINADGRAVAFNSYRR